VCRQLVLLYSTVGAVIWGLGAGGGCDVGIMSNGQVKRGGCYSRSVACQPSEHFRCKKVKFNRRMPSSGMLRRVALVACFG
jgi:hypothetical protein